MISTDLLLKGLGGVAVVGGATTVGVFYFQQSKTESISSFAAKAGLVCNAANGQTEETGIECSIKNEGLNVKQGDTNKDTGKKKDTAQSGTPAGKIKGYKDGNGFKFVIEEGDITLSGGTTNSPVSKLEQFETYEIKEDAGDKKQYLTRKSDAKTEIKKGLGLPDTGCDMPTDTTEKTCALDANKIKKINFEGKKGEPTVVEAAGAGAGTATTLTSNLKISKISEAPFSGGGYKFVLESNKEITLDSGTNKSIKKDTNTEFKIKVTPAKGGPKLSLEKAWTVKSLGDKVGLGCPDTVASGAAGECSLTNAKINVKNDGTNKFENHSKKEDNDNKKVKVEVDQEGYNQGFKFYAEQEICLKESSGGGNGGENKKIEGKGTDNNNPVTYEIKKDTDKWFLTKKTPAAGA